MRLGHLPMGLAPLALLCLAGLSATASQAQGFLDPQAAIETGIDIATAALANALLTSRDAAWAAGTRPMPPHIREALLAWYPAELLDSVEYTVGIAEGSIVQSLSIRYGEASAVTTIDTITFANAWDAENDVALWVHEVKHVEQFRRWGLMEFSRRYVVDHQAVEAEAYAIGAEAKARLGN